MSPPAPAAVAMTGLSAGVAIVAFDRRDLAV
jgi:hypothetical protein